MRRPIRNIFHMLSDFLLTATLQDRYYQFYCAEEDTEAQRSNEFAPNQTANKLSNQDLSGTPYTAPFIKKSENHVK